jgi:hypothetical protein
VSAFPSGPPEMLQRRRDPALLAGPEPGRVDVQGTGDLADRDLGLANQVLGNLPLPRIRLVSVILLGLDLLGLEFLVRPPLRAIAEQVDRLSEQLVAVANQGLDIDDADLDWPEPPAPVSSRK